MKQEGFNGFEISIFTLFVLLTNFYLPIGVRYYFAGLMCAAQSAATTSTG